MTAVTVVAYVAKKRLCYRSHAIPVLTVAEFSCHHNCGHKCTRAMATTLSHPVEL